MFWSVKVGAQPQKNVLKSFLSDIQESNWDFDSIAYEHFIKNNRDKLHNKESSDYKEMRAIYMKSLNELSQQLRTLDIQSLKILKYSEAPDSLQVMALNQNAAEGAYIALNDNGFMHYFHFTDDKIDSWIRFKGGKAFLNYGL